MGVAKWKKLICFFPFRLSFHNFNTLGVYIRINVVDAQSMLPAIL